MVTQDTSQWAAKKQGKVKQFLGGSMAELNLDTPPGAEKVALYNQRDGLKIAVPSHAVEGYLAKAYTTSVIRDGNLVVSRDPARKLYDRTPPSRIESDVGGAAETVSKPSGKKRKRGKRGRR